MDDFFFWASGRGTRSPSRSPLLAPTSATPKAVTVAPWRVTINQKTAEWAA